MVALYHIVHYPPAYPSRHSERVAIDTYTEMIHDVGEKDITTRRMLESILAVEEEHADDLASFLADIEKDWKTRDRKTG